MGRQVEFRGVSGGYFESMSIPMLAGGDLETGTRERQILVNATAARALWPGVVPRDVVGRDLHLAWGDEAPLRVVGVVGDVRGRDLRQQARPEVYLPYREVPHRSMTLVVRTHLAPEHLLEELTVWGQSGDHVLVMDQVQTLNQVLHRTTAQPRAYTLLLSGFALTSLLLTAFGTYSVVSYSVMQRREDWSVRLALGAEPRDLVRGTVAQGLSDALVGISLGLIGSLFLARLLSGLLFGISAMDPWTLAATTALMCAVVVLASYIPAQRATQVDPASALRQV
jgi:putative ABC transport system permease protein